MKLIRCFLTELKKFVLNPWFLLCMFACAVLSLFSVIYQDPFIEKTYTVWDILTTYSKKEMIALGSALSRYEVFMKSAGEARAMLVSILTALPFAVPMALERKSGNLRFSLSRVGTYRYCTANLLAAMVTGGFIMSFGTALFGLLESFFFPGLASFGLAFDGQCAVNAVRHLAGQFLLGCGAVLPAYFLAFITTNYYLIVCVPFLLDFLAERTMNWAFELFLIPRGIYDNWFACLLPDSLYGLPWLHTRSAAGLAVYFFLTVFVLFAGIEIVKRRSDRAG